MKNIDYLSNGVALLTTAIQSDKTLQIISLVLTCLATAFSLAFTIYKWYKMAKADGKIDHEEIEEAIDIVTEHVDKINNEIKKGGK